MQRIFKITAVTRNNIKTIVKALSIEQLNRKPKGFNNTIAWQLGHVIVTQQLLCYQLTANPLLIDSQTVEKYRKGSASSTVNQSEINNLIDLLNSTLIALENDYNNGLFKTYNAYETSFGYPLKSIEDAIQMNAVHEGLHLGNIMALKKLV